MGGFPWDENSDLFWVRRIRAISLAVRLRDDYSAEGLRALAKRAKDVNQSRRLLPLAAVRGGMNRREAARIGGMDRRRCAIGFIGSMRRGTKVCLTNGRGVPGHA